MRTAWAAIKAGQCFVAPALIKLTSKISVALGGSRPLRCPGVKRLLRLFGAPISSFVKLDEGD